MEADSMWGDHVILHAAANCFKTCIHVITSLSVHHDVTICPDQDLDSSNSNSRLMLGHVHEHHYVSLRPKPGKVSLTLQSKGCKRLLGITRCMRQWTYSKNRTTVFITFSCNSSLYIPNSPTCMRSSSLPLMLNELTTFGRRTRRVFQQM